MVTMTILDQHAIWCQELQSMAPEIYAEPALNCTTLQLVI